MSETPVISSLLMDRSEPIGNSPDSLGRRSLHTVQLNTIVPQSFDSFYVTYPNTTTEVYTYKKLGSDVAIVTITYTDSTKENLLSVVRS